MLAAAHLYVNSMLFHSCRFCVMFSFRWMDCRCSQHRFRIGWRKRRWMYLMCWLRPTSTVCCNWACYPPLVFCHCWYGEPLSWAYTTIAWSILWMIINILWWQPNVLWKKTAAQVLHDWVVRLHILFYLIKTVCVCVCARGVLFVCESRPWRQQ